MEWLVDLFNKLLEFLYRLLITLIDMLKDVFIWVIDSVISAIALLIDKALALIKPIPISDYLTAIPPEPAWMLSAIGIPQCLAIITTAIVIRLILQLVPFTRLGS